MVDRASGQAFDRPPRIRRTPLSGEIEIPAPPPPDAGNTSQNLLLALLPASGILLLGLMYLLLGGSSLGNPLFAVPMLALGVISVLTALLAFSYQNLERKRQTLRTRRDYHRLLDRRLARLQAARDLQLHVNALDHPSPDALLMQCQGPSLWERRPTDDDFGAVRLGLGSLISGVQVKAPDPDTRSPDTGRALGLAFDYRQLPGAGVALNLMRTGSLGVVGGREDTLPFLYSLLAQIVTFHAPADLNLYIFSSRVRYRAWNWARWLPHTSAAQRGGFPDYLAFEADHARQLLDALARRIDARKAGNAADGAFILVVFDDVASIRDEVAYKTLIGAEGVTALCIAGEPGEVPGDCRGLIQVAGGEFHVALTDGRTLRGSADSMTRGQIEAIARALANYRIPALGDTNRIPTTLGFLQMYAAETVAALNVAERWARPVPPRGDLPFAVPIGNDSFSSQLALDLSERAHGPHGVIAGTTGSGKSELLQTIVAALAVEHHPYLVNFLLIDYKGGAAFNVFRALPHTVGIITNLNAVEALRALEALKAENRRRQQFLIERNAEDITEYHRRLGRLGGVFPRNWEPLPHLIIIIDEFAELKASLPNFIDELVATVRVGRSLGMHLILSTQRPAGQVTPEMSANLNFRLCLRVQTPDESREVLRRPDAAFLPQGVPGRAYFQVGGELRQFQVARVGAEYAESADAESQPPNEPTVPMALRLVRYERKLDLLRRRARRDSEGQGAPPELRPSAFVAASAESTQAQSAMRRTTQTAARVPTLAEALAREMATLYASLPYRAMSPVLLPSLSAQLPLDDVMIGGWDGAAWRAPGVRWGRIPVGLIDDLANRAQPPLVLDFAGNGHFIAAGGPGAGKTTLLRTLAMAIARQFEPDRAQLYLLSLAGRGLDTLAELPHVGAVIHGDERERVVRLIRRLLAIVEARRAAFAQVNADDLGMYNERAAIRDLTMFPAIYVLIDNFVELRQSYEGELADVLRLIRDGRAAGVYFAITTPTTSLPNVLMNLIEQRFALHMPDKGDYLLFFNRLSERPLAPRPGSGLLGQAGGPPLHCQIMLPATGDTDDARDSNLRATIAAMRAAWGERAVPEPVQVLPENVDLEATAALQPLPPPLPGEPLRAAIGLDGLTLRPYTLDWRSAHFLVIGPVGSGKSNQLRALLLSIAGRYPPADVNMLLVDFGQESLRPLRRLPHVIAYLTDEQALFEHLGHFRAEIGWRRAEIARRGAGDDLDEGETGRCLFPPIIVAIDDYDQLQEALGGVGQEVFTELGQMIRRDSRLGFHFLVAGETTNMLRAGDPLLRQLRLLRSGFALVAAESVEVLGSKVTAAMRREELVVGRGYHIARGAARLAQFAHCPEPGRLARDIAARWSGYGRAAWTHRAPIAGPPPVRGAPPQAPGLDLDFELDLAGALEDYRKQQGYT